MPVDFVENNDGYLVNITKRDIIAFMQSNQELLFNERDFQMHLAVWLRESKHYDDVDVEYYIPYEELYNYIWKNELRLDIVVRKENEFLPIELKYKTKHTTKEILRFGERIADVEVLKDQGAQDLGMYDFWKDVHRIELVRKRFPAVRNGLAVFATNDESYLRPSRSTSNNLLLSLNEGTHGTEKHWQQTDSVCAKTHPNFEVEKCYTIDWSGVKLDSEQFYYCILVV